MESSALNTAHEKIRRAEALVRERKFSEAAECHEKIADILNDVHSQISAGLIDKGSSSDCTKKTIALLPSIHSLMTLESLALQRDYHKRQSKVVRMKQAQFEEYKNTIEIQQRNLLNKLAPKISEKVDVGATTERCEGGSLKQAIFRTIEEQDSLLNLMSIADDNAFKHPKDTGTVIEELRTVNNHLRTLVGNLLCQLESKEREVRILTERIRTVTLNENVEDAEIQANGTQSKRLAPLPPLAPLEMPLFDFNSS